jgi:hypothetical protein
MFTYINVPILQFPLTKTKRTWVGFGQLKIISVIHLNGSSSFDGSNSISSMFTYILSKVCSSHDYRCKLGYQNTIVDSNPIVGFGNGSRTLYGTLATKKDYYISGSA